MDTSTIQYCSGVEHCHKNVKVTEDFNAVTTSVSPETIMEVAPILMETDKRVEEPEPIVESEVLGCEIPPLTLVNGQYNHSLIILMIFFF